MEKLDLQTPDFTSANIARLAELFPQCVTESKRPDGTLKRAIDFDLLSQELSHDLVEGPQERYRLDWPGKREALALANAPIRKTLRPSREQSVDFDQTKNLYIEGDNLDALKLLQETYLGQVKMIYIDPPYNTGNDFIYDDDFSMSRSDYQESSGEVDEEGRALFDEEKWKQNNSSNGRFHSEWLSMMYPRLKLARNLLREDGVIFISIANDEFSNLKKLCDEVFGESNFVECITWNKRIPKNDKGVGNIHDFILIYVKSSEFRHEFYMHKDGLEEIDELLLSLRKKQLPICDAEKELRKLYKKQGYDRGITLYNSIDKDYRLWGKINMSWPNAETFGPRYEVLHPISGLSVKIPDRGWRWKKETFDQAALRENDVYTKIETLNDGSCRCGRIWFSSDEKQQPSSITYIDEVSQFLLRSILSFKSDGGIEVEGLFGGKNYFSHPKPTSLLGILLGSKENEDGDLIMDFFSGSATTAHAVMQLNAEDGGKRRHIMVQLPEPCDEKSEAFKAGYKTIAEIGKERIRRAGAKILEEWNAKQAKEKPAQGDLLDPTSTISDPLSPPDTGFRVLKVDSSNMADVYYQPDELTQEDLSLHVDNLKRGRSSEDLLFQVLLDWGVDLSLPVTRETFVIGKTDKAKGVKHEVFFVDGNAVAACFDLNVSEELVKELAKRAPLRAVFRDAGYASDSAKINIEQIFKALSPHTELKTL